jgi:hypothetical protein
MAVFGVAEVPIEAGIHPVGARKKKICRNLSVKKEASDTRAVFCFRRY